MRENGKTKMEIMIILNQKKIHKINKKMKKRKKLQRTRFLKDKTETTNNKNRKDLQGTIEDAGLVLREEIKTQWLGTIKMMSQLNNKLFN